MPFFFVLLFTFFFCTTDAHTIESPTHVQINSRPLSEKARLEIEQQRIDELPLQKKTTHHTTHAGALHNIVAIAPQADQVTLEDGSGWTIASADRHKIYNWLPSDFILITPNQEWFSNHTFCLNNQTTGARVCCNMAIGPVYHGAYTHWIVAIDRKKVAVWLEDGSYWSISWLDNSILNNWAVNDTVIIGINDGCYTDTKPNILINVDTLTYLRGKCSWK